MVFGTGANAGSALVAHPKVPLISFTGGKSYFLFFGKNNCEQSFLY
jgi:acyl-CoA reductase-like NAD-dependent aldehyde dehydrogenase